MMNYIDLVDTNGKWRNVYAAIDFGNVVAKMLTVSDIEKLAKADSAFISRIQYRRMHQVFIG